MYSPHQAARLYEHVPWCEKTTLDAWRNAHARSYSMCDALAQLADVVVTKVRRQRGGNISITVSVETHRPYLSEAGWFYLQKDGNGTYKIVEQHSSLDSD